MLHAARWPCSACAGFPRPGGGAATARGGASGGLEEVGRDRRARQRQWMRGDGNKLRVLWRVPWSAVSAGRYLFRRSGRW
jgi:hypothetical protein